jgi:hypothetical protein
VDAGCSIAGAAENGNRAKSATARPNIHSQKVLQFRTRAIEKKSVCISTAEVGLPLVPGVIDLPADQRTAILLEAALKALK